MHYFAFCKKYERFCFSRLAIVRMLFPGEVEQFSDDVCNYWPMIHDVGFLPKTRTLAQCYHGD